LNPNNSPLIYLINFLTFFKFFSIRFKRSNIENILTLKENLKLIVKLIDLIAFIVLTAHFISILWHSLAIYEKMSSFDNNWMIKAQI
jgi:hypothetical protein